MPPKAKISKKDIISATLELLRRDGAEEINARKIASELGCSTQPIFSNFSSMEELESDVTRSAYQLYLGFIEGELKSGKYPQYKAFGMAYIRFAREEKELFKYLLMSEKNENTALPSDGFDEPVEIIMKMNGISREVARMMHLEMWALVHGIATMIATSFLDLDNDLISTMLSDTYHGLCQRHTSQTLPKNYSRTIILPKHSQTLNTGWHIFTHT